MLSVSALLVACGGDGDESSTNSVGETSGDSLEDVLTMPEFKWEGEEYNEFNVLIYSNEAQTTYYCEDVEPNLYDTTDEIRRYGQIFIIITACFFPVHGFLNALYFTLRSGGKTLITFLFDSVYSWAISVPLALVLCHLTPLSILAIYAIIQSLDIIKIVVGYILVKRGIWISNLVSEN